MAVFPLLEAPTSYRACVTDLIVDDEARAHWLELFGSHFSVLMEAARGCGYEPYVCARAHRDLLEYLEHLRRTPDLHGRLDILMLDEIRQMILCRHGIIDEFRVVKERENALCLKILPLWLTTLEEIGDERERLAMIYRGMLAGNVFDMGVKETSAAYASGGMTFEDALARVPERPYLYDDIDACTAMFQSCAGMSVMIFVDNAGSDVVLGVLPLVRQLVSIGVHVKLAANERPSLNDVTAGELRCLLDQVTSIDDVFASSSIDVISSGNVAPLIDLTQVNVACADAARDCAAVLFIGMGRGLESNFHEVLTCPSVRIAMVKDTQVARTVGGKMFDAVIRYVAAAD